MIGLELRKYRKQREITIPQVEKLAGISSGFLSRVERGIQNISDKALLKLLTKGFDLRNSEAKLLIAEWRSEEIFYNLPKKERVRIMEKISTKYGI